jgi:hypothetical protein
MHHRSRRRICTWFELKRRRRNRAGRYERSLHRRLFGECKSARISSLLAPGRFPGASIPPIGSATDRLDGVIDSERRCE